MRVCWLTNMTLRLTTTATIATIHVFLRMIPPLSDRNEALHSFARKNFARIDDALRIHADHVEPKELAAVLAHAAKRAENLAVIAIQKPDVIVRQIGNKQETLRSIRRKRNAAGRSSDARILCQFDFLFKVALFIRDMDAVGIPIRCINQTIIRE